VRLVLDLETSSTADLRLTGAAAYAEHPDTRVTVLCYAVDDGPVQTVTDFTTHTFPGDFGCAVWGGAVVVAHNYMFEWNIYYNKLVPLGWPRIKLTQWSCTMARCYVAGYPGSLELASKAAKLAIPKDVSARDLMLRMARPRTTIPETTWWHETSPEHFARLCAYCATDVEAERLLDKTVPELSARERAIFEADHQLNQRGLRVDELLVTRLRTLAGEAKRQLTAQLMRVTNGQVITPNQVARLRAWLAGIGLDVPDLRRTTVQALLLRDDLQGPARLALQARLDASRSSTAKLDAILSARSGDGRVRGCFQYYGANRTGRWAGRRLQPQNLFRGSIKDVPTALISVMDPETTAQDLELLYEDSAMGVVASCVRSTIQARPGYRLVILDYSQIEARVLAWIAGEQASLDCFARGDDIYEDTARRVGSPSRQLGKVLVLACGYGMGALKFQLTAAGFGVALDLPECEAMVMAWRAVNKRIVRFWWEGHKALLRITRAVPGSVISFEKLVFKRKRDAVLVQLPSGRHLVYRAAHISRENDHGHDEFCYMGSPGGGWVHQRSWPGKIAENIVQAIARDVLAEAMITLHQLGVPLVATVHDELIAEVPASEADATFDLMQRTMQTPPPWALDLPMDAAGFIAVRYHKK
jgi:DNA polymerase